MINLTSMQLAKAASIKQDIEALEQELRSVLGNGHTAAPVTRSGPGGKRVISESGKARIAAAQRKRWAKFRKASRS